MFSSPFLSSLRLQSSCPCWRPLSLFLPGLSKPLSICSSSLSSALKVGDGVTSGLEANGDEFRVNGKDLKILSGSLHYFR